jgi:hypothetical protein
MPSSNNYRNLDPWIGELQIPLSFYAPSTYYFPTTMSYSTVGPSVEPGYDKEKLYWRINNCLTLEVKPLTFEPQLVPDVNIQRTLKAVKQYLVAKLSGKSTITEQDFTQDDFRKIEFIVKKTA